MMSELRNYNPGVVIVTENCVVCDRPVREEDEAIPAYATPDALEPSGWLHGRFDCTDSEICPIIRRVTAGGGSEGMQACLLPEGHDGDDLWGEPA